MRSSARCTDPNLFKGLGTRILLMLALTVMLAVPFGALPVSRLAELARAVSAESTPLITSSAAPSGTIAVTDLTQKISNSGGCSLPEAIYSSEYANNIAPDPANPGSFINTPCEKGTGDDTRGVAKQRHKKPFRPARAAEWAKRLAASLFRVGAEYVVCVIGGAPQGGSARPARPRSGPAKPVAGVREIPFAAVHDAVPVTPLDTLNLLAELV